MTDKERQEIERQGAIGYDWYYCRQCGGVGFAPRKQFRQIVELRGKLCIACIDQKDTNKNRERAAAAVTERVCEICEKSFLSKNARYCSPACRKKGSEKSRFYTKLKAATREANMADVHVYGQGKYPVTLTDEDREYLD